GSRFYNRSMDQPAALARRQFLTVGIAAVAAGSAREGASGVDGYAFVSNEEAHAVAAVDLSAFAVARQIRLNDAPGQVLAPPKKRFFYVLTRRSGNLHEIETETLAVRRTLHTAPSATSMKLSGESTLWVLSGHSR